MPSEAGLFIKVNKKFRSNSGIIRGYVLHTSNTLTNKFLLLLGVWFLYGSFGLIATSLAPIAEIVIEDLAMTHGEMGLIMGAWQLIYIFSAVPAGMLLDRIGTKKALAIGGSLIALSAFARSGASDFSELLGAVMLFWTRRTCHLGWRSKGNRLRVRRQRARTRNGDLYDWSCDRSYRFLDSD